MTDERRVEVAAEADAAHLMWRGEPQHKPTRWTCSGCGTVVTSPAERDASRTAHAALDAELRAKVAEARTWRGYKTRDIGDAFDATTVTDLLDDLDALLDRHAPTLTTTED